jgi:YggT family protein
VSEVYVAVINVVQAILTVYWFLLIATAVISWVPDLAETQLGQLLARLTDPYLRLFRRYIPGIPLGGVVLDLSFIVAVIVFYFIEEGIMSVLIALLRGLT